MTDSNIRHNLLTQSVNAAIRAGAAIMEIYNGEERCTVELKSDYTPLIEADKAAHIAIKEALGASRIPILSEEGREMEFEERQSWDLFWLVDPLDGTAEFIKRSGEFTVNIALIYNGEVASSVIYAPSLRRLTFAGRGLGAHLLVDVEPSGSASLSYEEIVEHAQQLPLITAPREVQRVAITRTHKNQETYDHLEGLKSAGHAIEVVEQGSSYKFVMLAEGSVDYYIRTSTTYEWDTAAGILILSEAGGRVEPIDSAASFAYNKADLRNPRFRAYASISKI